MRTILVGMALALLPGTVSAECVCACIQGRATEVCSRDPMKLNLPIICQRLCLEPVITPLPGAGNGGGAMLPTAPTVNGAANPMMSGPLGR